MSDDPIITPIGARIAAAAPKAKAGRSLSRDVDRFVCVVSALTAMAAFALSGYFFYGFTQTDTGFWTLASAFGLCFGVGALAYGPCAIVAVIARRSAHGRANRKAAALALFLSLPWVCVALVFIGWSALPLIYGGLALVLSTGLSIWALSRLRRLPKT